MKKCEIIEVMPLERDAGTLISQSSVFFLATRKHASCHDVMTHQGLSLVESSDHELKLLKS